MGDSQLIYIFGAGRSGTTILATLLGNASDISTVGEMHYFLDHLSGEKKCSCGKKLSDCREFWSAIFRKIPFDIKENISQINELNNRLESHINIPFLLMGLHDEEETGQYLKNQQTIFNCISDSLETKYVLDSAKYISRAVLLNKLDGYDVKYIFMVRDIRGVAKSFKKNVQTSKNNLQSYLYYNLINSFGELFYRLLPKGKVLKIKYEDLIEDPFSQIALLENHLSVDLSEVSKILQEDGYFTMPHLIGGNRIRKKDKIKFKRSSKTRKYNLSDYFLYLLSLPLMLINKYKLL